MVIINPSMLIIRIKTITLGQQALKVQAIMLFWQFGLGHEKVVGRFSQWLQQLF